MCPKNNWFLTPARINILQNSRGHSFCSLSLLMNTHLPR